MVYNGNRYEIMGNKKMTDEELIRDYEGYFTDEEWEASIKRAKENAKKTFPKTFEMLTGVKYKEGMDIRDYV